MSQDGEVTDKFARQETLWRTDDGRELAVGGIDVPQGFARPESPEPFVFLSYASRDGSVVREEIVRPTGWFLKELKVKCFFVDKEPNGDNDSPPNSSGNDDARARAVYACTHALVILSPTYRLKESCVKELNTFMRRRREAKIPEEIPNGQRKNGHRNGHSNGHGNGKIGNKTARFYLILALLQMQDTKGYHPDLQNMTSVQDKTESSIYYMIFSLWPRLIKALDLPPKSLHELQDIFIKYVEAHAQGSRPLPFDFTLFVEDHQVAPKNGNQAAPPSAEATRPKIPGRFVVGVFSTQVYKRDDPKWNEEVLKQKHPIEENLKKITEYGIVSYGNPEIQVERKGWFGWGAPLVVLECEIRLREDLDDNEFHKVQLAAMEIRRQLEYAGSSDTDLERMFTGTAWGD